jgi:hypothetical protein
VIEALTVALAVVGMVLLVPLVGGWRRLSRAYPASIALPVRSPLAITPYVGTPWYPVWARVGASKLGIYLEPAFPASLVLPPLFVPWAEITAGETQLGWHYAELRASRCPSVPIYLVKDAYDQVRSRVGADRIGDGDRAAQQ